MRKIAVTLSLIAFALVAFASTGIAGDHGFVGADTCKMCHNKDATGAQYTKWLESAHAQAFEVLGTEDAKAAADKLGLEGNPQELGECLQCHQTAYGVDAALLGKKFDPQQGVSCESCHGPGADYKKKSVMEDQEAAVAAGMIIPTEETCLACHNDKSPTFVSFDYEAALAKIAHPNPEK
jgi:hypothetical protein